MNPDIAVRNMLVEAFFEMEHEAKRAADEAKSRAVAQYAREMKEWEPKAGEYVEVNPHGLLAVGSFVNFTGRAIVVETDYPGFFICINGKHVRVYKSNIRPFGKRCPCCGK